MTKIPMGKQEWTPEAEALADSILKASGSALRHYSLAKTREAIIAAAQIGIDRAKKETQSSIEDLSDKVVVTKEFVEAAKGLFRAVQMINGRDGFIAKSMIDEAITRVERAFGGSNE